MSEPNHYSIASLEEFQYNLETTFIFTIDKTTKLHILHILHIIHNCGAKTT